MRSDQVFPVGDEPDVHSLPFPKADLLHLIAAPDCPYRLVLMYDQETGELSVFRDFFGRVPFFYIRTEQGIYFSTCYKDLSRHPGLAAKLTLNEELVYNYISPYYPNSHYGEETFFQEIKAALPGYKTDLVNGKSEFIVKFQEGQYSGLSTLEEYGKIYRDLFQKSVSKSIEGITGISSQLSGGLDSSSIVSVARQLRPQDRIVGLFLSAEPITSETPFPDTHDVTYARSVSREKAVDLCYVTLEPESTTNLMALVKELGQPPFIKGIVRQETLISEAREQGCDLMMTGSVGDSVVGYGFEYLNELYQQRNWSELKEAFRILAQTDRYIDLGRRYHDTPLNYAQYAFFRKRIIPLIKKRKLKEIYTLAVVGGFKLRLNYFSLIRNFIHQYNVQARLRNEDVQPINQYLIKEKPVKLPHPHCRIHVNQTVRLLEDYHDLSGITGIQIESPYCDPALYHLCESVPYKMKFFQGMGRGQLREGMKGILPEKLRLRSNKTSPDQRKSIIWLQYFINNCGELLEKTASVWKFADRDALLSNIQKCIQGSYSPKTTASIFSETFRIVLLSAWLKANNR